MRIGFIAFSGVRAFDEELMRLGLTFPGVLDRSTQVAQLPSLGLLTLAGMTPAEHQFAYHEIGDLDDGALPGPYDLVAISSMTAQIQKAYALAARYRAEGTRVVIGGLHVTALASEAMQHVDAVVVGEGESVWLELLEDAARGELKPVYDARAREFSLSESPMPAFEILDENRYNRITIQTSRGCPHQCSFCASSILLTKRYKQKPVARVLAEIDRVRTLWRRPFFELADDNSFVNRAYWRELLPELEKRKIRWFTEADISVGDDEEFLHALKRAGCKEVLIGLESSSLEELDGVEVRANWKMKRQHTYRENIRRIQDAGIRVNGCFIFGFDGQTSDVFDRVYAFARDTSLFDVQLTLLTPFPGTPLFETFKKTGRLLNEGQWDRFTLFDVNFVPRDMTVEELRNGFRDLAVRMYDPEFQRQRRRGFRFEKRSVDRVRALSDTAASTIRVTSHSTSHSTTPSTTPAAKLGPVELVPRRLTVAPPQSASAPAKAEDAKRGHALQLLSGLKKDVEPLRKQLLSHPIYRAVDDVEKLRTFMESHVFAVWDFMSLVKRLQRELTCTQLPWIPAPSPMLARFINDIVLTEESDVGPNGEPTSHLELYVHGMAEVGAQTGPFLGFLDAVRAGDDAFTLLDDRAIPASVAPFVSFTLETALHASAVEVAAQFLCAREDIIPEMFERLVTSRDDAFRDATHFVYYLERHIHLDAEEHGPMAEQLLISLAGTDEALWQRASTAAQEGIRRRLALWDGILAALGNPSTSRRRLPLWPEHGNQAVPLLRRAS